MKRLLPLAIPLAVAACAAQTAIQPVSPRTVAEAELALTAAERAALAYTSLPPCPAAKICADPALKAKIKSADVIAYNAVVAARDNPALAGAAWSAITALGGLIPTSH
jgi:hypothetical protein